MRVSRRRFLQTLGGAALALPFEMGLGRRQARAAGSGNARRVIFFYYPDGVVGSSESGQPSQFHCYGGEYDFTLGSTLDALQPWRDRCVFFNGLSLGPTDSGSHPGGAKKLLTAVDHGNGQSIDQWLAQNVGADRPHRHVYLGAMANHNNASGDKHISYPSGGASTPPDDNPLSAFGRLFDGSVIVDPGNGSGPDPAALRKLSVLDAALADLNSLRSRMGPVEKVKLDMHLSALEEVEQRIALLAGPPDDPTPPTASCNNPQLGSSGLTDSVLYDPAWFPTVLGLQMDVMVQAMACGLTRVGVIQASHHTSELIMSRFPDTAMHDPDYDMRSHQASHYGASHDEGKREFASYRQQRRWWAGQLAHLLELLDSRPEDDGTMLDHSLVVCCSEVSDGNTHSHDNMPFIVAGGAGGRISTGRLLHYDYMRHANLWVAVAQAMGADLQHFGEWSEGPLPGLLG